MGSADRPHSTFSMPAAPCSMPKANTPTRWAPPMTPAPTWNGPSPAPLTPLPLAFPMFTCRLTRFLSPAGIAALLATGCGRGAAKDPDHPGTFGLTENQRARIHLAPVADSSFQPSVSVSGTVAFDGDHSTQVLAPISGPVSRILVEPGAQVTAGQPLAYVSSPDFAAAMATYRKANATAVNLIRIAVRDSTLFANDALARQDLEQAQTDAASAIADRDAALDQLRAIGVDSAGIANIRDNRNAVVPQGVIRAPLPGTVVE